MKKQLRISQYKDYVAVDIVDKNDDILSTPIYLKRGKSAKLLWKDQETKEGITTTVIFDGEKILCEDRDGFEWESPIEELLTEAAAIKP